MHLSVNVATRRQRSTLKQKLSHKLDRLTANFALKWFSQSVFFEVANMACNADFFKCNF